MMSAAIPNANMPRSINAIHAATMINAANPTICTISASYSSNLLKCVLRLPAHVFALRFRLFTFFSPEALLIGSIVVIK